MAGDHGVVADEEEGTGEDADDGDDEWGEVVAGVGVGVGGVAGGWRRREDEVAPLRAVDAAKAQRAVLEAAVWRPWLACGINRPHGSRAKG